MRAEPFRRTPRPSPPAAARSPLREASDVASRDGRGSDAAEQPAYVELVDGSARIRAQRETLQRIAPGAGGGETRGPGGGVQRALSPTSNDPADWEGLSGGTASGGVTGVIVASNDAGEEVVVKGLDEAPQRAMLAQEMMARVGLTTVETRAVAVASALGQHILECLEGLGGRLDGDGDAHGARIRAKARAWRGGATLLLMEHAAVKNLEQLLATGPDVPAADEARTEFGGGDPHEILWRDVLGSPRVWKSLGKMFFVDQFLGNEDRLQSLKLQNIFLDAQDRVVALDNDAMMPAYIRTNEITDALMGQAAVRTWKEEQSTRDYVRNVVLGGSVFGSVRTMASLEDLAGGPDEIRTKVRTKAVDLLGELGRVTANPAGDANKAAANTVVTQILLDPGSQADAMLEGANEARETVLRMFNRGLGGSQTGKLREAQKEAMGKPDAVKDKALYSMLALSIRRDYLLERAKGRSEDDAIDAVEVSHRSRIRRSGTTGRTRRYLDENESQKEEYAVD